MTAKREDYDAVLDRARQHAGAWLESLDTRRAGPSRPAGELSVTRELPAGGLDPVAVLDELVEGAGPGLMAMPSGRFFGWVIGGTLPAALGADWLVSSWDQNSAGRFATPAVATFEEVAAAWLLDLLGLPTGADVGFVTGATMANFTCLGAARTAVLTRAGWDVEADGLTGAPKVSVIVGAERHETVDVALRYLGLGRPAAVAADDQGRLRADALAAALAEVDGPVIVVLQAGNLHSGAFDPFTEAIEVAHAHGAWVHVDGAFGLWAAASPQLRHLAAGVERADSWATDAHKTLNVPYDCGVAIVADPGPLRTAFGVAASYLVSDRSGPGDQSDKVPELSRRGRGVPVWAALRSLGREGVAALVERLVTRAHDLAEGCTAIEGAEVLNQVPFTQVCVSFGSDERTRAVTARCLEGGEAWMSGSRWHDRDVLRISVSNWSTDEADVARSLAALQSAAAS